MWRPFLIIVLVQVLAFCIFWRRLKGRYPRAILISLFLAGNLPWPFFYAVFNNPAPSLTWFTALILRFFTTWQIGLLLWLVLGALFGLLVLIFFRLPLLIVNRQKKKTGKDNPESPERREFLVKAIRRTAWGAVLGSGAWGIVRSEFAPRVVKYTISPAGLPKSLDGLTIAHLSDLHIGFWTSPNLVPRSIALTRDLKPDIVVITGDIIDHRPSFSKALISHLYLLDRVPLGVYGIIGNHDIYTGADQVTDALESGGIKMLRDRHHSFRDEGLPLVLAGVDDPGRNWSGSGGLIKLDKAVDGMDNNLFPVLLTHRPTGFEQARKAGIPITLCGHTHGGQFGLPGGPNLADPFYDFTHGLYEKDGSFLHVSSGVGSVGLPFRLGVPAEIALLKLSVS